MGLLSEPPITGLECLALIDRKRCKTILQTNHKELFGLCKRRHQQGGDGFDNALHICQFVAQALTERLASRQLSPPTPFDKYK
jgi:hypothetical protein